ncbi:MAG: cation diffusion facilitator family transporter [Bacteroidales bacterium]|jgi:cation diffusion facilitator family transporter|nr:cation diffusion facilitator family transporter [Bacteroidales bacterium]MDD3273067.1 cation diffusion facilitator family transporter [Bacteroidales bacterium]MDD4057554.1 cation diffusion facilitator family transporter [Bacteroidales bacterium]
MENRGKEAKRVTIVGFFVNLVLTLAKITAGILGKSAAMLADGVHSLSDFVTDIVVIAFVNVSGKDSDDNHKYGHGKFETFATLIISLALAGVGIGIFINGLEKIIEYLNGREIEQPGMIALWAALISIVSKEILFRYTIIVGKRINSPAVIANGWHHRSDAFSSLGTALGISGAIFLGESWRILDPIAGIVVSLFIMKVSYDLGMPSVKELLEASLPKDVVNEIETIINTHPDVIKYHHLKTRKVGTLYAIDVHIKLNKEISFVRSHDIATEIELSIREKYGNGTHINIHTEPL